MKDLNLLINGINGLNLTVQEEAKLKSLSNIIVDFHGKEKITDQRLAKINDCCQELKDFISMNYPNVKLEPYGSAVSGFGSKVSDADFSVMLRGGPTKKKKILKFLEHVAKIVEKPQPTWKVVFVDTAKVPIVTLCWKDLEVDLSYHNKSALENTEILKQYCLWEPERLPALGFWVKKWAKSFDICSKRNGTLSSYTFILMVIFYLQRCTPRVLPYLHTEFWKQGEIKLDRHCYHKAVVPNWSKNGQSVGELFRGFLEYFSVFDFHNEMIQIRWIQPPHPFRRTKEYKSAIVVRDCVERRVNIAEHVKKEKMDYIRGIFIKSRNDVRRWIKGEPMVDETMKTLFNVDFN